MLELRAPIDLDESTLRLADIELESDGSNFLLDAYRPDESFSNYLERVRDSAEGKNLLEGRVPSDFLVAVVDGQIVGRSSIRHELNDWLFNFGGHIGYAVRPGFRRLGYASEILRQSLLLIRKHDVSRVLMTCNDQNLASQKVIEKHGGILENKVDHDGVLLRRYWIELS